MSTLFSASYDSSPTYCILERFLPTWQTRFQRSNTFKLDLTPPLMLFMLRKMQSPSPQRRKGWLVLAMLLREQQWARILDNICHGDRK